VVFFSSLLERLGHEGGSIRFAIASRTPFPEAVP
jgi:hypothetical protein